MSICNSPSSVEFPPGAVIDGDGVAVSTPVSIRRDEVSSCGNSRNSPQSCGNCGRCNSGNTVGSPSRTWVAVKSDVLVNSEENDVGLSSCVPS